MAMIMCSACGKDISDKAAACIGCGAPVGSTQQVVPPNAPLSTDGNAEKTLKDSHSDMAMGKCKDCNKDVSLSADSCPHCDAQLKESAAQFIPSGIKGWSWGARISIFAAVVSMLAIVYIVIAAWDVYLSDIEATFYSSMKYVLKSKISPEIKDTAEMSIMDFPLGSKRHVLTNKFPDCWFVKDEFDRCVMAPYTFGGVSNTFVSFSFENGALSRVDITAMNDSTNQISGFVTSQYGVPTKITDRGSTIWHLENGMAVAHYGVTTTSIYKRIQID